MDASLRFHPLAMPVLLAGVLLMASTLLSTLVLGTPFLVHKTLLGRLAVGFGILAYGAAFLLFGSCAGSATSGSRPDLNQSRCLGLARWPSGVRPTCFQRAVSSGRLGAGGGVVSRISTRVPWGATAIRTWSSSPGRPRTFT